MEQQELISKQTLSKFQHVGRNIFMKKANSRNLWTFELITKKRKNIPTWVFVGFQQKDRQGSQNVDNDTLYRPPVTSTQCIIGTETNPDAAKNLAYDDGFYSQGYGQTKEVFRFLTKDDTLNPYISDHDFISTNVNIAEENYNTVGYTLYAFGKRYQKNLEAVQPVKVEFKISDDAPAGIKGYALVLANKLVSVSSNGQRLFDLI